MSDYKLKRLEDLIITLILNNKKIEKIGNTHEIYFELKDNKLFILENYLNRLNIIDNYIQITKLSSETYVLHSNLTVERVIRDLNFKNGILNCNPKMLNINIFLIMLCLFSFRENDEEIIIKSNLNNECKNMLSIYANLLAKINLEIVDEYFVVNNLNEFINLSIKMDRPYYETVQLVMLLNKNDYQKLYKNRQKTIKGRYEYATI